MHINLDKDLVEFSIRNVNLSISLRYLFYEGYDLEVIYHLLYSMNTFVTNKSKLTQDGAKVFPYMG